MRQAVLIILLVILVIAALLFLTPLRDFLSRRAPSGPPQLLALGGPTAEYCGLLWLAEDKGLFRRENVRVTHALFDTGAQVFQEVLAGRLDIALMSEFAFVSLASGRPDLVVLGSIAKARTLQVAALRERGIGSPRDLRGKRMGVPLGTTAEYALANFLLLNDLPPDAVTVVPLGPTALEGGLREGKVDAVIAWEPHVHRLGTAFGAGLVTFPAQKDRETFYCLVTTESVLAGKSRAIEAFLRALVAAEEPAAADPAALRAGIVRNSREGAEFVDYLLPLLQFEVSLEQALVSAMEEEGRWMTSRGTGAAVDYLARVRSGPMRAVKSAGVTIVDVRGGK
jgi:NitT/TauT family transport system substrate-binding protein